MKYKVKFHEILNKYLQDLKIAPKELAEKTGISPSVISRYRSGERTPKINSIQLTKIIDVFKATIDDKKLVIDKKLMTKEIKESLTNKNNFDYDIFSQKFKQLINTLKINLNDMAKYMIFDPSHLSRIKNNKSHPSDPCLFCQKICEYIDVKYEDINELNNLLENKEQYSKKDLLEKLYIWLTNNQLNQAPSINKFLEELDNFDLNDYIKNLNFDKINIPSLPFYYVKEKAYYGLEGMKEGEIAFFKAVILSKKNHEVFMHSDMPMEDMAKDTDFGKKWMMIIALTIKKGLKIKIVHNLDRPFNEMMLGLQSWIPLYMTGLVEPYYFKDYHDNIFSHLNYISEKVVLEGECIKGSHKNGKYQLITNDKDIDYYHKKANDLLKKASSLMQIFKDDKKEEYKTFLKQAEKIKGQYIRFLSHLPIWTIDEDKLVEIIHNNHLTKEQYNEIIKYYHEEKAMINTLLKTNTLEDNIYLQDKTTKKNLLILISNFNPITLEYSSEEYQEHLKKTINFAKKNNNYHLQTFKRQTFNQMNITIIKDKLVIITKTKDPVIHFVIHHNKLVNAIQNFKPLIDEK